MGKDLKALFTLDGKRIKTLISVPMYTKVLIVSTEKVFKGLVGIDKIRSDLEGSLSEREKQIEIPGEN